MNKKELEEQLMKMPELEQEEKIEKHKWLNNINTFQAYKNELCLRGIDEDGKDLTIWFDSYDFLKWIDAEHLEYIKEQLIKHIKEK